MLKIKRNQLVALQDRPIEFLKENIKLVQKPWKYIFMNFIGYELATLHWNSSAIVLWKIVNILKVRNRVMKKV